MPTGVGSHFLQLLGAERRFARRRVLVAAAVALALVVPAYFIWPWEGLALHAAGLLAGAAAGWLLARRTNRLYEASVRREWQEWMRLSVGCESLRDIRRRARGRSLRNDGFLVAGFLTLLWAVEVLLLAIAFAGETAGAVAAPVVLLNAAALAGLATYFLVHGRWVEEFGRSVTELVDSGEIGVWGVV